MSSLLFAVPMATNMFQAVFLFVYLFVCFLLLLFFFLTIMISLQRHMTSSVLFAELKGNIFGRTIYPLSLIVIAFILAK